MRPAIIDANFEALLFEKHPHALDFLRLWREYVHAIDDLVDGDEKSKEAQIRIGAIACSLFSTPFYVAHVDRLQPIVMLVTNNYADSVAWENATEDWKRQYSEVLRHAGADMVRVVIWITHGYNKLREVSPLLLQLAYYEHHDADGKPI